MATIARYRQVLQEQVDCGGNRLEPRAVKRRPKEYALLNRSRNHMRKALLHW
jgi:hypothetical protein